MSRAIPARTLRRAVLGAVAGTLIIGSLTACSSEDSDTVTIGYQPGLIYAPVIVASKQDCFKAELPDKKVVIKQLNSGSALRDAQLTGDIQVGVYGLGAFLVGWDNGVPWKALEAVADTEIRLMVTDPEITSLSDLRESGGQIAVQSLDSPQVALLKHAADEEFGDAGAFDTAFSVMGHPDAVQALKTGQVAAHFTTPPFTEQEEAFGAREITNSTEILGAEATTVLLAAKNDWVSGNPEVVEAISTCMGRARKTLTDDPERAAAWLSESTGGAQSRAEAMAELAKGDVVYTDELHGLVEFAEMMKSVSMLKSAPDSADDLSVEKAPRQ